MNSTRFAPSIEDFEEISRDPSDETYSVTRLSSGAFLLSPASFTEVTSLNQRESQAHRAIVAQFREALISKYGKAIVNVVFNASTSQGGPVVLTLKTIKEVLSRAEQTKEEKSKALLASPHITTKRGSRKQSRVSFSPNSEEQEPNEPRRRSGQRGWDFLKKAVKKQEGPFSKGLDHGGAVNMQEVVNEAIDAEAPFKERQEASRAADLLRERGLSQLNQIEEEQTERLKDIEKEARAEKKRIKDQAGMGRVTGNIAFAATRRQQERAVDQAASHQKIEACLEFNYPRHNAEKKIIASYLQRRAVVLREESQQTTSNYINSLNESAVCLIRSVEAAKNQSHETLSDEILLLTMKARSLVEALQFFVLAAGAQEAISAARLDLIAAAALLRQEGISPGGEGEKLLHSAQRILSSSMIAFDFAQAQSPRVAAMVAEKNSTTIRRALEKVQRRIKQNQEIIKSPETSATRKDEAREKLGALEQISKSFRYALFAYEQLGDENEIEVIAGPLFPLKEKMEKELIELQGKLADSEHVLDKRINTLLQSQHEVLMEIAENLEAAHTQPANPSEFLDELDSLRGEQNSDKIVGANGKIFLTENRGTSLSQGSAASNFSSALQTEFSEEERREWVEGIQLIRFGLCRNFNIRAVQRFDDEFGDKIQAENSLTVGELKEFLEAEKEFHASSHFLSPPEDVVDFMERLNRADGNKIVKWDERTMTFNPFAGGSTGVEEVNPEEVNKREIADGRAQARRAIENIFTNLSLPEEKVSEILARFDMQFPSIDLNSPTRITTEELNKLTVEELRSFIQREMEGRSDEGELWMKYLTPDRINATIIGGFTALGSAAVGHIVNSQISAAALASIGVGALTLIPPLLYLNYLSNRRAAAVAR